MDPSNSLGVKQQSQKESLWHREMARKANDIIRVFNPTDKDFVVNWEGNKFRVSAKSTAEFPRYIALAYRRDMVVQLINELSEKKRAEWEQKRKKEGAAPINDYEKNMLLFPSEPRTDNEDLVRAFSKEIWLGTVKQFGLDEVAPQMQGNGVDLRTLEDKVLEELDDLRAAPTENDLPDLPPFLKPTVDKKQLEDEISVDTK